MVWAPKCQPPRLPLTIPSRSYFSRESPFAGPSRVSSLGFLVFSIFSLSSRDLYVSPPSFCLSLVVRGREIKNIRRWSYGAEKIKGCYQLRGSEKHVHSKEGSTGHLYECPCTSASVCDCLSTEALRAAMCQVPQTLAATLLAMLATLGMVSMTPGILLLQVLYIAAQRL